MPKRASVQLLHVEMKLDIYRTHLEYPIQYSGSDSLPDCQVSRIQEQQQKSKPLVHASVWSNLRYTKIKYSMPHCLIPIFNVTAIST